MCNFPLVKGWVKQQSLCKAATAEERKASPQRACVPGGYREEKQRQKSSSHDSFSILSRTALGNVWKRPFVRRMPRKLARKVAATTWKRHQGNCYSEHKKSCSSSCVSSTLWNKDTVSRRLTTGTCGCSVCRQSKHVSKDIIHCYLTARAGLRG